MNLDAARRALLRPGERVLCDDGAERPLPRFFYRVDSEQQARAVYLAPFIRVSELVDVDLREAELLRRYPRYLPAAASLLAAHLSTLRMQWDTYVHVATNGAYRSPAHEANGERPSAHCWGTAANIYRIGGDWLQTRKLITKYRRSVAETLPALWTRPYGVTRGKTSDQLHLDLGYLTVNPRTWTKAEGSDSDRPVDL
jgi:hypothetical protein